MNRLIIKVLTIYIIVFSYSFGAQAKINTPDTPCSLKGIIKSYGQPLPFATISIKNTTLGAASNLDGAFEFGYIPEGEYTVIAQAMGYKPAEKVIVFKKGEFPVIDFELEEDVLGIEQVVVTADRNEQKRTSASVIVNTLTPKLLENAQAISISEGLNYVPGLRIENNCQNCGFTQVRMNGMDGAHSQVLINNRAIFSNLAGVYGLELIPSSMIDRIEVVRGGGSALYGSNAVAGTINLITKDPVSNSYDIATQYNNIGVATDGKAKRDYSLNMNTTIVSDNKKTGIAIFGFYRDKDPYDANGDGFSEISQISNLTFGGRFYHRIDYRNKITADFIRVNEQRRGGNMFDNLYHEADIAEAVDHEITTGAITYERFVGTDGLWSVYGSAQNIERGSYYGANKSIEDYGHTSGLTYNAGTQYKADFGKNTLVAGIELVHDDLLDKKLGYPDYNSAPVLGNNGNIIGFENHIPDRNVADQQKDVYGVFAQYDRIFGPVKASVGMRFDSYKITDNEYYTGNNSGNILSPRVNILWDIIPSLQWRVSYSQGYRAPQVFDEDLHIESSGSRKVIYANDPDLEQETSHSYMISLDFNRKLANWNIAMLAEGFYTKLDDAFAQNPGEPDENGVITYYRTNADNGAAVKGINMETTLSPNDKIYFRAGYTVQSSKYGDPQELGEKEFLRTPQDYGFASVDYDLTPRLCLIANSTYTGKMKVAYYGNNVLPDDVIIEENGITGTLRTTDAFFDIGVKAEYEFKLAGLPFKAFVGMKNIFNSYQDDFDSGIDRDPAYIYGPTNPRTVYSGIKLSNVF